MHATKSMSTLSREWKSKNSMDFFTKTTRPQCIEGDFLKDNSNEFKVELRGTEADDAMTIDPPPSYSEHLLAQSRHILQETDLDEEFLCCVNEMSYGNKTSVDKNSDSTSIKYSCKSCLETSEPIGKLFQFDDHQLSDQFQTKYDAATGETRVKLGVYDYPIDISSCFTDAEKCLQQNNAFGEDIENESAFGEICSIVNYERFRETIPLADISSTCAMQRSYASFSDYLQVESASNESVPCIDNRFQPNELDLKPMRSFTQLHSYTYRTDEGLICGKHDIENDEKLAIPKNVSPWNLQTKLDRQLSNCDNVNTAHECKDQTTSHVTQSSSLFIDRHAANTSDSNSKHDSRSCVNSKMLNVGSVPDPNIAASGMIQPTFSDQRSSREFGRPQVKSYTPTMTVGKQKRTLEKSSRDLNQSHKTIKRASSLIIPYTHESLLTSAKIWNSNGNTNQKQKKKFTRGCKLWEFIRNLLLTRDTNPTFIKWENREEGTFKLVQSKAIAHMWGMKKGNGDMTYEKLSRAMRYYYKKQVFQPVIGKRLIYKFGPRATGWRDELWI